MVYSRAHSPATREDERAELIRIYTTLVPEAQHTAECLMASKVGSVWYLAIRLTPKPDCASDAPIMAAYVPDETGAIVYAGVVLTSRQNGEWGYKDMCETMGPCEATAPLKLLDLLSPLDPEKESYAQNWRDRVRAHHATRRTRLQLRDGDIIEFDEPAQFSNGVTARRFKAFTYRTSARGRAQMYFETLDTPHSRTVRMSLQAMRDRGARLIAPDGSTAKI
jgi:hypothetical protein